MSALSPPPDSHHSTEDAGAHDLSSSDDNDHFSDASEGRDPRGYSNSHTSSKKSPSPVPITRVERVDDEPSYGEVPNTDAYSKRSADAVPDEVEIIPDGHRSRATSRLRPEDRPGTPGGSPVPMIVAEKIDPDTPAYGDVPGTEAYEKRKADAVPDQIIRSPDTRTSNPWNDPPRSPLDLTTTEQTQANSHRAPEGVEADNDDEADGAFGDDFDDFEEGGGNDDDDFGEFDDGFAGAADDDVSHHRTASPPVPQTLPTLPPEFPIPDLRDLSPSDLSAAIKPYLISLFPPLDATTPTSRFPSTPAPLLTPRSSSLWSQLSAPSPVQPPNWTRSYIRRMFLVSIGVPLDLDEMLPPSKQKKLILPSLNSGEPLGLSPGLSSDDAAAKGAADRLKTAHRNESSTSITSADSAGTRARKSRAAAARHGPPPPPAFDASAAQILAGTTVTALEGMSDDELESHVGRLYEMETQGRVAMRYWEERVLEAGREKEAFEAVIGDLVRHAKNVRK